MSQLNISKECALLAVAHDELCSHRPSHRSGGAHGRTCGALVALLVSFLVSTSLKAEPQVPRTTVQAGIIALKQGEPNRALHDLEESFLREPNSKFYEILGQVAERTGNIIAAADLYRRFLEERPEAAASRPRLANLIAVAQTGAAELAVSSREPAFLRVDGRLVGRLPLSRPLLLSPGKHILVHFQGGQSGRRVSYEILVRAGVPLALQFEPDSPHVAFEERPAVVLAVFAGQLQPRPEHAALAHAVLTGLRQDGQAYDLVPERAGRAAPSAGCLTDPACLVSLARRLDVHGVLSVVTQNSLSLSYLDARSGTISERGDVLCAACSPERTLAAARASAYELVHRAVNRAHGTLEVHTKPHGAQVAVTDSYSLAQTPARLPVLAGSVELTLRRPGSLPLRTQVEVAPAELRTLDLVLQTNHAALRRQHVSIGKWLLLSSGLAGVTGGIVGVALNHNDSLTRYPDDQLLGQRFQSLPQGAAFLGLGLVALCGSIALSAYERILTKQAAAAETAALK